LRGTSTTRRSTRRRCPRELREPQGRHSRASTRPPPRAGESADTFGPPTLEGSTARRRQVGSDYFAGVILIFAPLELTLRTLTFTPSGLVHVLPRARVRPALRGARSSRKVSRVS